MVRGRVVLRREVALRADLIAGVAQFRRVRIVTIGAGHAGCVHLALQKRAVVVDLVLLLAVRIVQVGDDERDVVVEQARAGRIAIGDVHAAGVTLGTRLDLVIGATRRAAIGNSRRRIGGPMHAATLGEPRFESIVVPDDGAQPSGIAPPRRVPRARTMTRFARHVDFGERRAELIGALVVALSDRRRMTVDAIGIPVVLTPRPVELVLRSGAVTRREREPALTALDGGAGVPGDGERLHASPGELHEVLLERIDAERPADLVIVQRAVFAVGVHEVAIAAAEERRRDGAAREARGVEPAEHRAFLGVLHGDSVLRRFPGCVLGGVARGACRGADELGARRSSGLGCLLPMPADGEGRKRDRDQDDGGRRGDPEARVRWHP